LLFQPQPNKCLGNIVLARTSVALSFVERDYAERINLTV